MTTSHSVVSGVSHTNTHMGPPRSSVRLPSYAVGFLQLVPSWSTVQLARTWTVADLFVAPAVRNKGVASLLLTHARKFAADTGAAAIDIHTTVHNSHMQRMFGRLEFARSQDSATFSHSLL